jgi:hypothetical protein
MSEKIEIGIDPKTGQTFRGVFTPIPKPPPKEPEKAVTPEPKCWVTQTLVYIRYPNPSSVQPPFGTSPIAWGSLSDCRARAKELSNDLNLPITEIGRENPNLQAKDFESPGIYIVCEKFDQFNDPGHRVFRY